MNHLHIAFAGLQEAMAIAQFQVDMAKESEGTVLVHEKVLQGVRHAMEDAAKGRYVVAFVDGVIVGSLMLTREWSDWTDRWYLWIQSVYVKPAFRGQGVYRAMYQWVKDAARTENISQVRLYVDRDNHQAQQVYQRLGMNESHYLMYEEEV